MKKDKKIVELPTAKTEQPAPQAAPQPAKQQPNVIIVPMESYQALKDWAYNTLSAAHFDTIMKILSNSTPGHARSNSPEKAQ